MITTDQVVRVSPVTLFEHLTMTSLPFLGLIVKCVCFLVGALLCAVHGQKKEVFLGVPDRAGMLTMAREGIHIRLGLSATPLGRVLISLLFALPP